MWSRFDGETFDHPKWAGASLTLIGFYCKTHTYASRWLTDGRVPMAQVKGKQRQGLADDLVRRKVWHRAKGLRETCPDCSEMVGGDPGDGYVIHDYLKLNLSKAEVERRYADSRAIRVAGGKARASSAVRDRGRFAPAEDQQTANRPPAGGTSSVSSPVDPIDPVLSPGDNGVSSPQINHDGLERVAALSHEVGRPMPRVSRSEIHAEAGRYYGRALTRGELA